MSASRQRTLAKTLQIGLVVRACRDIFTCLGFNEIIGEREDGKTEERRDAEGQRGRGIR